MIPVCTYVGTGDERENICIFMHKAMPKLEALARLLSEFLGVPVSSAQVFSLEMEAVDAGIAKMVDGLWDGDPTMPETVEAVLACVDTVSPTELVLFLADPAFAACEEEYQAWIKANHPDPGQAAPAIPVNVVNKLKTRYRGIDTAKVVDHGVELCIWFDNIPKYERLAALNSSTE